MKAQQVLMPHAGNGVTEWEMIDLNVAKKDTKSSKSILSGAPNGCCMKQQSAILQLFLTLAATNS